MFLQTILTKYIRPTSTRGAKVTAFTSGSHNLRDPFLRFSMPWDHEVSTEQNHIRAAKELAERLKWTHRFAGGPIDSECAVYVFTPIQKEAAFDTRELL